MKHVLLPAEKLSDFQYRLLTKVANRENKSFLLVSAVPGDASENETNILFNEFLQLIELGFFLELDRENEAYANLIAQFEQKGQEFVMAEMTNRGLWMWEQTPWEKWVN